MWRPKEHIPTTSAKKDGRESHKNGIGELFAGSVKTVRCRVKRRWQVVKLILGVICHLPQRARESESVWAIFTSSQRGLYVVVRVIEQRDNWLTSQVTNRLHFIREIQEGIQNSDLSGRSPNHRIKSINEKEKATHLMAGASSSQLKRIPITSTDYTAITRRRSVGSESCSWSIFLSYGIPIKLSFDEMMTNLRAKKLWPTCYTSYPTTKSIRKSPF